MSNTSKRLLPRGVAVAALAVRLTGGVSKDYSSVTVETR